MFPEFSERCVVIAGKSMFTVWEWFDIGNECSALPTVFNIVVVSKGEPGRIFSPWDSLTIGVDVPLKRLIPKSAQSEPSSHLVARDFID